MSADPPLPPRRERQPRCGNQPSWRRVLAVAALAATLPGAAACGSASAPPAPAVKSNQSAPPASSGASPSAGAKGANPYPLGTVTIGWSAPAPDTTVLWTASQRGYFRQQGLDVKLVKVAPAVQVSGTIADTTQFAVGGGAMIIEAVAKGANLKDVASLANRMVFSVIAKRSIKSMADLRGHSLAVTSPYTALDVAARLELPKFGLTYKKDVHITYGRDNAALLTELTKGAVAATILPPPWDAQAISMGFHRILNIGTQGGQVAEMQLYGNGGYIQSHPAQTLAMVKGLMHGLYTVVHDYSAYQQAMNKYVPGMKPADLKVAYDETLPSWKASEKPSVPTAGLRVWQDLLSTQNANLKKVNLNQLVDTQFVQKVAAGGPPY